jgi:hypothetical protein
MHKELLSCISETPLPESRLPSSSLSIAVNEQLTDILALNLTNKNYRNALITLHQLRYVLRAKQIFFFYALFLSFKIKNYILARFLLRFADHFSR